MQPLPELFFYPRNLRAALAEGSRLYFTGKPCPKGHNGLRRITGRSGECEACRAEYKATSEQKAKRAARKKEWRRQNPEKAREMSRAEKLRYDIKYPEKKLQHNARLREKRLQGRAAVAVLQELGIQL